MIQVLNSILSTDICTINEKNKKIVIMSSKSSFPEDYIEADYSKEKITIKEIHRSNEKIVLETENVNRASLVAGVLALRLFFPIKRDELVDKLRMLVKEKLLEDACQLLNNEFSSEDYSIGLECYDKISLIEAGDIADVKYHSEYLAQGAGLPRAYAALYNYCKRKRFIEEWCAEKILLLDSCEDISELVELYILGHLK